MDRICWKINQLDLVHKQQQTGYFSASARSVYCDEVTNLMIAFLEENNGNRKIVAGSLSSFTVEMSAAKMKPPETKEIWRRAKSTIPLASTRRIPPSRRQVLKLCSYGYMLRNQQTISRPVSIRRHFFTYLSRAINRTLVETYALQTFLTNAVEKCELEIVSRFANKKSPNLPRRLWPNFVLPRGRFFLIIILGNWKLLLASSCFCRRATLRGVINKT